MRGFLAVLSGVAALFLLPAGALAAGTWTNAGGMTSPRTGHSATALPNGTVLVTGGRIASPTGIVNTAEIWDPASSWSSVTEMIYPRVFHTATLLQDGNVLIAGGANGSGYPDSVELYHPADDSWSSPDGMSTPRVFHTATLLPSGKVLVAAGYNDAGALNSVELYAPGLGGTSGTWSTIDPLATPRMNHAATLLNNGNVLITGGVGGGTYPTSVEIYDPTDGVNGSWSDAAPMGAGREGHTATLLRDGRVLVAGGTDQSSWSMEDTVELYDPVTDSWSYTGSMETLRVNHTATLLPNGKVLVAGGRDAHGSLASAELFDPATGTWSSAGDMQAGREAHTATLLANGRVLIAGGADGSAVLDSAELYTPETAVLVPSLTAQFSDCTSLEATVTPAGLSGVISFLVNGSTSGLLGSASYDTTGGAAWQGYRVCLSAGDYPIDASFSPEDTVTVCSGEATLTVTPEAMTVTPFAKNPTQLAVPWQGKPSGPFVLKAAFAQEKDGCYGAIAGTEVTCELQLKAKAPLGMPTIYSRTVRLLGLPGPLPATAAFAFGGIPVGVYDVTYIVDDGRYLGEGYGRLAITQPPLVWQRWVEPSASCFRTGQTITVAFLLKYGVTTDAAMLTVTGPSGAQTLPGTFVYDPASGRHRYPGGLVTSGWPTGRYTLRVDLPDGTWRTQTFRLTR